MCGITASHERCSCELKNKFILALTRFNKCGPMVVNDKHCKSECVPSPSGVPASPSSFPRSPEVQSTAARRVTVSRMRRCLEERLIE